MSVTTTTTAFRNLSRAKAIELLYVLEEQRDKQIARAKAAEADLAAAQRTVVEQAATIEAVRALADKWVDRFGFMAASRALRTVLPPVDAAPETLVEHAKTCVGCFRCDYVDTTLSPVDGEKR